MLNCVGLPWIETGDRIVVMTQTGGFESFIFERHLKGIQALKDEFESKGEEYTKLSDILIINNEIHKLKNNR